jgi:hypothetical protein
MTWPLSRFRTGDLIEVRSKEEILATLDEHGCVDGMPFMPEMLRYCGRRFRVSAVAHKTCETAYQTYQGRRLANAVHLEGLRCDGSAHGGCQADCNLFWKDVWLKRAGPGAEPPARQGGAPALSEQDLAAKTLLPPRTPAEEPHYACQATMVFDATEPLPWWDPWQYVLDIRTGNASVGGVLRNLWLASLRWLQPRVPFGYRFFQWLTEKMYRSLAGRSVPSGSGKVKRGARTPTGRLDLKPGEYVRVKSLAEIEVTLDQSMKNRGLGFDPEEMAPYCGRVFRVRRSVTQILHEVTGKMLYMKQPCIILEGVVCTGAYATCRLNCPRAFPCYWREIWLERAEAPAGDHDDGCAEPPVCRSTLAGPTPAQQRIALPLRAPREAMAGVAAGGGAP